MLGNWNYFGPESVAKRYAKGRPFFHPNVISRIKSLPSLSLPIADALDVGCGTGLSTAALTEVAQRVVGLDLSMEMIRLAPQDPRITYIVASAEALPFDAGAFDLVTVSSVFHWLNRRKFMSEARRVLRRAGHLVVYDNYFSGRMRENERFHEWLTKTYLEKYPSPPRSEVSFTHDDAEKEGFRLVGSERYENEVEFEPEELIAYLTTQSNLIAAVEGRGESIDDAQEWLMRTLKPLFGARSKATFVFQGPIWFLQRAI